jgi:23S rRNA pseudouridine1911/1915/1917 synthase
VEYIASHDAPLLDHLKQAFPDSSSSTLRSWIEQKRIFVNEQCVSRANALIKQGSSITLGAKPLPKEGPLKIVYEDADLIVIDKPSGLLSVANEKNTQPSVHAWIKHRYPNQVIPVVHRLDKDTSGLMLFALNSESFRKLKEMLAKRIVKRVYRALVEGRVTEDGVWKNYLREDANLIMRVCSKPSDNTVLAVTHYNVIKTGTEYSLIDCSLETGKKNQIRVQAFAAGHPIAGDAKYGSQKEEAHRLCLHARLLEFEHPTTKKNMVFESEPPTFFNKLCR